MEDFDFGDVTRWESKPFSAPGGITVVLREADGAAAAEYRRMSGEGSEIIRDQETDKVIIRTTSVPVEVEPTLVARCLFSRNGSGVFDQPLSPDAVKRWPERVIKRLFDVVVDRSDLRELPETVEELERAKGRIERRLAKLSEDAAKNSPSSSTGGSAPPSS